MTQKDTKDLIFDTIAQAFEEIRPYLNHSAISEAERQRLALLCDEARASLGAKEIRQFYNRAWTLLGETDALDEIGSQFRHTMRPVLVWSKTHEPELVPSALAPADLIAASIRELKAMQRQVGSKGSQAEQIELLIGLQEQLDEGLAKAFSAAGACSCQVDPTQGPVSIPLRSEIEPTLGDLVKIKIDAAGWPCCGEGTPYEPHILGRRVVLTNAERQVLDRGACPDQFWPTFNPLQAMNWPDHRQASETLSSPTFLKAMARPEASGYRFAHVIVIVLDHGLADTASKAVAG